MKKSMRDWGDNINDMGSAGRKQMINALKDLDSWSFFKEAYEGYGLNHVLHMLETVEKTHEAEKAAEMIEELYDGYTHAELTAAFNKVADPDDWKAPIFKRVWLKKLDVTVKAIKFFTGTEPKVERFAGRDDATVTSEGYRAGPAGDH